jgi:hypothetical protein
MRTLECAANGPIARFSLRLVSAVKTGKGESAPSIFVLFSLHDEKSVSIWTN